jgi:hypothetical protein
VDRGYEGDSGYLAHLGSAAGADRWDADRRDVDRWDTDPGDADRRDMDRWDVDRGDTDRRDVNRWDVDRWDSDRRDVERWDADRRDVDRWDTDRRDADQWADRWDTEPSAPYRSAWSDAAPWDADRRDAPPAGTDATGEDATVGVARRLQARLDRQLWLLERLQAEQLYSEPPGLHELRDTARQMRRDSERLLLLCGAEPGARDTGPRRLGELLAEAAAAAEEPRRVDVRPGPAALVAGPAAVDLLHVIGELIDHVSMVYPGARVELVGRLELPADLRDAGRGAIVDVVVEGAARREPDEPGGQVTTAAEQIAKRSRHGIVLRHPPGGAPLTAPGLVASVHCPPAAVTTEEPVLPPVEPETARRVNGTGLPHRTNGSSAPGAALNRSGLNGLDRPGLNGSGLDGSDLDGSGLRGLNGSELEGGVRPTLAFDDTAAPPSLPLPESPSSPPPPSSSSSSGVDELFGPLIDLPLEPIDDRYATPIFEAIASAWFQEGDAGSGGEPGSEYREPGPLDWETPHDDEWREAAARAARSEPAPTTASGLPMRRPGNQLVPPPRSNGPAPSGPPERAPDRVRERLSTYQRGLIEGRHHAVGSEEPEPEHW